MSDTPHFVREDVKILLGMLEQAAGPTMSEMTLEEARASYIALHQMTDRPARELAVIRDLTCPGPAGDIALRLYDSRDTREAGPVIMFYHGGGFVIGDLDTHHNLCTEIAAQMDFPVLAVDYRLAPEHPFPAAVDDCEAATRWAAGNPAELGRSATGLILMGDSAGGNATIVTMQALRDAPADCPVILQVPLFPLASNANGSRSMEKFAEGFLLTKASMEFFDQSYAADTADSRAFPILSGHAGSAPAVIATASLDPIRDSGRDYAAALGMAGIDHVYLEMRGITHSFSNLRQAVPSTQGDLERVFAAMKFMLGNPGV
ncbi:MAG: alpha/beta hydrolase [Pontixanthobacter sp.]